jgi:hypothetical protein
MQMAGADSHDKIGRKLTNTQVLRTSWRPCRLRCGSQLRVASPMASRAWLWRAVFTKIIDIRRFAESDCKELPAVIQRHNCHEQTKI